MPLYLRLKRDHFPDDVLHKRFQHIGWVVLSGSYQAGSIGPPTKRSDEGRWNWYGGFGPFGTRGTVDDPEQAKEPIAAAFREAIARVGLAERADAKPGAPVRDVVPTPEELAAPERPPFRDYDHPVVIHQPRRASVYSGEMLIGLLHEQARVPDAGQWSWNTSGTNPRPPGFVWRGQEKTLDAALAAHRACWLEWITWAGLEQKEPTRWKSGVDLG